LSLVELLFASMKKLARQNSQARLSPAKAEEEFNERFRRAGVGYQINNGTIFRSDSEYVHDEVTKPALLLLTDARFKGANDEFLKAHEQYREGDYKAAINSALNAFESTMKTICLIRTITFDPRSQAKDLIALMVDNTIVPVEKDCQFSAFRTAMESGLPTTRNKTSGHGQGPTVKEVPRHVAAHALHTAAANIVFLVEGMKTLP